MSADAKMISEREAVARERVAYGQGAADRARLVTFGHDVEVNGQLCVSPAVCNGKTLRTGMPAVEAARALYRLPTVTRPRIGWVNGDNYQWRVVDGYLQARVAFCRPSAEWKRAKEFMPHWSDAAPLPERVKMWADLFARPTETVEDPS